MTDTRQAQQLLTAQTHVQDSLHAQLWHNFMNLEHGTKVPAGGAAAASCTGPGPGKGTPRGSVTASGASGGWGAAGAGRGEAGWGDPCVGVVTPCGLPADCPACALKASSRPCWMPSA